MNKTELINSMAEQSGLTKKESTAALSAFLETVEHELSNDGDVVLTGFGKFSTAKRAARVCRNPKTSELVNVPAKLAPKFKFSKIIVDSMK